MKVKKNWILVIASFSILMVLWPAQQITGDTDQSAKDKKLEGFSKVVTVSSKEVLQGLEGVGVLVEYIRPEVEKYGLTEKDLQTDTELQLRQYGIKVLNREELRSTTGVPYLYINAHVQIRGETPVAAAAILVEFRENVVLLREPKRICVSASTWRSSGVASVGLIKLKVIRENVKDHVNEFINDYLAANPKEQPVKKQDKKPKDEQKE